MLLPAVLFLSLTVAIMSSTSAPSVSVACMWRMCTRRVFEACSRSGSHGVTFRACRNVLRAHAPWVCAVIEDRSLFTRERQGGAYRVSSYFFSGIITEFPFALVSTAVFVLVVYPIVGYKDDFEAGFFFFLV